VVKDPRQEDPRRRARNRQFRRHRLSPGAIDDVTDQKARFILDGQALGVKRSKIFGLIYFHATAASTPDSPYSVLDTAGSRWDRQFPEAQGR